MSNLHDDDVKMDTFDSNDTNDDNFIQDETTHIIRIRGLPWATNKQEILNFFCGINIVNGQKGVHMVTLANNSNKPLGEAYIELASYDDLQRAHGRHGKHIGLRYIEVFESTFDEFRSIMNKQRGAEHESVVRLRGLPWNAKETDIAKFFQGLQIKENNGIHIPHNRNGKSTGEAFVHFETVADCEEALKHDLKQLGHRYIEIFRSTEQQLMRSIVQTSRGNFGGRNGQQNDNKRLHPYGRNENSINFGRGNQSSRGRNQNNHNDFRRDHGGDMFMQNSPNNRNFNRMLNPRNGGNNFPSAFFNNDRFNQYQNSNDNFFEDFDLNQFSKNLDNLDRSAQDLQNMTNRNQRLFDFSYENHDFIGNLLEFNSRGNNPFGVGNNGNNPFGVGNNGNNPFGAGNSRGGGTNNRFNNNRNNRNFSGNNETRSGQHCIHMRGLPYFTDEMDVFNFFAPLKPTFCKIIKNKKGLHSGEAKAYFDYYEQVRTALSKDRMKIGNRYIELFYAGSN